jgi:hypothetical protein
MAQVQHALSHFGGGQHTATIGVDWHLLEYVRDGIGKTEDLTTALTITGEPHAAYACFCEEYVKFAWQKCASITEFFRDFAASRFISLAEGRKSQIQSTLTVADIPDCFKVDMYSAPANLLYPPMWGFVLQTNPKGSYSA